MQERRRNPRVSMSLGIRAIDPSQQALMQTESISMSGMFVRSEKPFSVGTVTGIEISAPGLIDPMFLKSKVTRIEPSTDEKTGGMGIEFIEVPPRERFRLEKLINSLGGEGTVLLVTKDKGLEEMIHARLNAFGCQVISMGDWPGQAAAAEVRADIAIVDLDGQKSGLRKLRKDSDGLQLVILSRNPDAKMRAEAASLDIYEVIEKPVAADVLVSAVEAELETSRSKRFLGPSAYPFSAQSLGLVARSWQMKDVYKSILRYAELQQTVLITGETGAGKNVIARALHRASGRSKGPITVCDCTQLDKNLMESKLFGHEKGAFTGAEKRHIGFVEEAGAGVLLLDEIGELPLDCQAKLLRLLEEGEYRRLGGNKDLKCKAWIIATTNRNLYQMVHDGSFRQDLLYRLQAQTTAVPPLRDRVEDKVPLARLLLNELNEEGNGEVSSLGPEAIDQIEENGWHGNVRELKNALSASMATSKGSAIEALKIEDAEASVVSKRGKDRNWKKLTWKKFKSNQKKVEKEYLKALLAKSKGNISKAADHAKVWYSLTFTLIPPQLKTAITAT